MDECLSGHQKQGVYGITVRNLMLPNVKQWDMSVIRDLFNFADAEEILQIVEELTYDHESGRWEEDWCSLWNIKAPPKVKHLLWRICKGCLPTRDRL
ncbi:hypothetical protein KIW84_011044 [Lathyrus oleraceus]|uniref:Reverse transcriptase zinc-binding domain-containing protein n=1 Tax=Pisum sativum TaxID=3888 RepID=A0A9D4YLK7_PEA|nr:hypothetical protein KIW84_011044 [Pisum sativum]